MVKVATLLSLVAALTFTALFVGVGAAVLVFAAETPEGSRAVKDFALAAFVAPVCWFAFCAGVRWSP